MRIKTTKLRRADAEDHANRAMHFAAKGDVAAAYTEAIIAAILDDAWEGLRRRLSASYFGRVRFFVARRPGEVLVLRYYPGDDVTAIARRRMAAVVPGDVLSAARRGLSGDAEQKDVVELARTLGASLGLLVYEEVVGGLLVEITIAEEKTPDPLPKAEEKESDDAGSERAGGADS